jgi:hypothetical protein
MSAWFFYNYAFSGNFKSKLICHNIIKEKILMLSTPIDDMKLLMSS